MFSKKVIRLILIVGAFSVTACGQKGPLEQVPEPAENDQPVEQPAVPSAPESESE